ncbi:magnesium/cobalt transporter CorA [Cesiribacter sp. SM1]|uniref:magnesium/cobalt transporter CorA n=1 Tax=Cesiribacter sp. SM1 TaxID=2861196 RepID=UPI001CD2158D|nr:magnesium/cobalt transporter CorA [Cesiribacter sp. SM1]
MSKKVSTARQAIKSARNIASSLRNKQKVGLPPGSILYTGEHADTPISMQLFSYNEEGLKESFPVTPQKAIDAVSENGTTWLNVDGVHDVVLVEHICRHFKIHPLTIEDIVSTRQRPKVESMEGYLYVVLKVLEYDDEKASVGLEQISLLLGPNFVLSFQERPGDTFEPVRNRLRAGRGRIRGAGADYLLYALIDTVVDNYFVILDRIDERADQLEELLLTDASKENFDAVYHLKREMLTIWRSVWPLRDVMYRLERGDFALIQDQTQIYLRDVSDHMTQIIDIVEVTRDLLKGMADLYHSTVGSRTNEVMRVLTIISTIFIPLTFIVGVYGMNFDIMPELRWRYGYLLVWIVMITLTVAMLVIFRRKKWL